MAKRRQLSPREHKFAILIADGLSQEQAALQAGYSQQYAHKRSFQILRRPHVMQAVRDLVASRIRTEMLTPGDVIGVAAAIAFHDLTNVVDIDDTGAVRVKPSSQWTAKDKVAIQEIKQDRDGNVTIKTASKLQATEMLAKMMGIAGMNNQAGGDALEHKIPDYTDEELEREIAALDATSQRARISP